MRWDELVNVGELRLPGPLQRYDAAANRALGRRPGWRLRRAVSALQPLVWLAGGTPPSRIGYGPGFLQDRRERRHAALRRPLRIALLEEHRRGTRFGHALASFINERSSACTAVVNDTTGADLAWVFTQDPIEPGARARLARVIGGLPASMPVLNPLAHHDAYHADDCFDRLRAAGVGVPRTAFTDHDRGRTEVVYKAVDQQPSAKFRAPYHGPVPGHRTFAYVDARGADGRSRRYRAFFVAGMVWTGDVILSGDWKASLDTLAEVEHGFTMTRDEREQIAAIARTLGLDFFCVDYLRRAGDGAPVFVDVNVYPTIVIAPFVDRQLGCRGRWPFFDTRARFGLPEPDGAGFWERFDHAMLAAVARPAQVRV